MARLLVDPICYCFEFMAITPNRNEPVIKQAVADIMQKNLPVLLPLFQKTDPICYVYHQSRNNQGPYTLSERINSFPSITEPLIPFDASVQEKMEEILKILQSEEIYGFALADSEWSDHYQVKSTKFEREYWKHFQKEYYEWSPGLRSKNQISANIFQTNPEMIWTLLNRESPTLEDVVVPKFMMHGANLFYIWSYSRPLMAPLKQRRYECICDLNRIYNGAKPEEMTLHQISFILPRCVFQQFGIATLQKSFCENLEKLGSYFPLSFGSIYSDYPGNVSYDDTAFAVYDRVSRIENKKCYFSKYVPGYAWGMLINPTQVYDFERFVSHQHTNEFFKTKTFANGNMYFQMTDDLRSMTILEGQTLRKVFKPYLPPVDITFEYDFIPPSFRLGFLPDEIRLLPYTPKGIETPSGLGVMFVTHQ